MPMQPPRFGRSSAPRGPWVKPGANARRRKRGRAGVKERHSILAEEPLCRPCLDAGRTTQSEEVDHIDESLPDPLWDARANKQGICKPCHKTKTAKQAAAARIRR